MRLPVLLLLHSILIQVLQRLTPVGQQEKSDEQEEEDEQEQEQERPETSNYTSTDFS